jgi:hypothetical protein
MGELYPKAGLVTRRAAAVALVGCVIAGEAHAAAQDPTGTDNVAYAKRCVSELGLAPEKLTDLNCLAGKEVSIHYDDDPVTTSNWTDFVAGGRRCENPQWLTGQCHTYDFVQLQNVGDVEILLNCRQTYYPDQELKDPALNGGNGKFERFLAYAAALKTGDQGKIAEYRKFAFLFNDMAVVLRHAKTGKVCYFTFFQGDFFGGFIPNPLRAEAPDDTTFKATLRAGITAGIDQAGLSPADKQTITALADDPNLALPDYKKTSQSFYYAPTGNGQCAGCHAYGGFQWSPFMRTAAVLPSLVAASQVPFLPVGFELAEGFRSSGTVAVQVASDDTCTQCHRLASQGSPGKRGCNHFDQAIGNFDAGLAAVYSAHGLTYPSRAWMPLGHGVTSEAAYNDQYKAGIDAARCCCEHPTANGCNWRRYGPNADDVDSAWRTGKAPADVEAAFGLGDDTAITCPAAPAPP